MMKTNAIAVCPVCGKLPKTKKTLRGGVIIQCKPTFGKTHLRVQSPTMDFFGAKSKAINLWNTAATAEIAKHYQTRERMVVNCGRHC